MNDNNKMMETLMQQMASSNPKLMAIMEMMKQQQAQSTPDKSASAESSMPAALKKEVYKRKKLVRKLKEMEKDFEVLESLLEDLAVSLGACSSCWGTHTECAICSGEGKPGYYSPNKEGFITYVLPVIKNTPWVKQILVKESEN